MPQLTRRKDTERPDCWNVYFGDVGVGAIGRRAGVPLHVDQWEWSCGFYPLSLRGVSVGGMAQSFEQARDAFGAAWLELQPRIEETDYAENGASAPGPRGNIRCTTPVCRRRRSWHQDAPSASAGSRLITRA